MSNLDNRITQLEKIHNPTPPAQIYVYYHDKEKGYSEHATGPYYATLDELSAVLGWKPSDNDTMLSVVYASQDVKILIPDNGRDAERVQP